MDETDADLEPFVHIGSLVSRILPPLRRSHGALTLRRFSRRPMRGCRGWHGRAGRTENLAKLRLTVVCRTSDTSPVTIMGEEGNVVECALVDVNAPEIPADGLDHVEIVGPTIKWVYYTVRWGPDGQPERRECVTVTMPVMMVEGGMAHIRERYAKKIREYPQNAVEAPRPGTIVN